MDFLANILRYFFFFLDGLIYKLMGVIYQLFTNIANTTIISDTSIGLFAERVYALLGIFMLFKVSFSILTYIVNPDEFSDKSKGFGKLISNIMITLGLLILTPWIFKQAMDIQRIILKDNVITQLFIGDTSQDFTHSNDPKEVGDDMALKTFTAFYKKSDVAGSGVYIPGNIHAIFKNNDQVVQRDKTSNDYVIDYNFGISTICGGLIVYLLVLFCLDVAIRSVKLGFLRMLAPVPIISRLDPKKGKEIYDKWVKESVSTYLDLFVRLIAINFAMSIVSIVSSTAGFTDANTGEKVTDPFVIVIIILGALAFAKQLPKLVGDLFGFKLDGFEWNPLKKLSGVPLVGRPLAAAGNLAGAAALAGGRLAWGAGSGLARGVGSAIMKKGAADSFKSGFGKQWGKSYARAGTRMQTGLSAAKTNVTGFGANVMGDASKYKTASLSGNDDFIKGSKALKEMDKDDEKGRRMYDELEREYKAGKWQKLDKDGNLVRDDDAFLLSKFSSNQFKETFTEMNKRKGEMYKLEHEVDGARARLNAAYATHDQTVIDAAQKDFNDVATAYGKAQGRYKLAEKRHDISRGMYKADAKTQDIFDSYGKVHYGTQASTSSATTSNTSATSALSSPTSSSTGTSQASSTTTQYEGDVTGPDGKTVHINYNPNQTSTPVQDGTGHTVNYGYVDGMLTQDYSEGEYTEPVENVNVEQTVQAQQQVNQEVQQEVTQQVQQNVQREVTQHVNQEVTQEVTQNTTQEVNRQVNQTTTQTTSQETKQETHEEVHETEHDEENNKPSSQNYYARNVKGPDGSNTNINYSPSDEVRTIPDGQGGWMNVKYDPSVGSYVEVKGNKKDKKE